MNGRLNRVVAGALALAAATLASVEADAMLLQDLAPSMAAGSTIEKAYLVCGRFGCVRRGYWHRPYYGYGWRRPYYRRWYR